MSRPVLEPEVGVALFNAGENLLFPISQVAKLLGWDPNDFLPYLRSGELTAFGVRDGHGYRDVSLKSQELVAFMARHKLHFVP